MTNQEKILNAIKTATSQQPIGMLALIDQLGIDGNTMADELEALYNAKRINRCLHTKDGITQQVVWPTNIVTNVKWGQFEITKPKPSATPPRQLAQPQQHKETTMPRSTKPLEILQTIYSIGHATTKELRKLHKVADVVKYVQWYIDNGYMTKSNASGTGNFLITLNTQTAPATAQDLYDLRHPSVKSAIKKMTDATVTHLMQASAQTESEQKPIPEQLKMGSWIEWHGGDTPPVSGGDYVEFKLRSGYTHFDYGYTLSWVHTAGNSDIIAYRICKTESEILQADTFTEQIEIERKAAEQWSEVNNDDDQQEYDEFTKRLSESMSAMADMHPLNSQVGGDHYKNLGIYQPWEVLARWMTPEELRGFAKGTVIAYLARERQKGGDQDIEKALHTLQLWQALKDINQPSNAEAA